MDEVEVQIGETTLSVDVDSPSIQIDTETGAQPIIVEVVEAGPQGPPGESGDANFVQAFTVQSSVTVNHDLGKYPAVTVMDSANDEVVGSVEYVSINQLIVSFAAPFSGVISCN